jgi:hypothetical protein
MWGDTCTPELWIRIGINSLQMYFYFFHENLSMLYKILKIMTHWPLPYVMRNEKHCKLALLLIELKKLPHFQTCVKLGRIRMWNPDPDPDLDGDQHGKLGPGHRCTVRSKVFINGKFLFFRKCIRVEPARGKTEDRKQPDCHYDL